MMKRLGILALLLCASSALAGNNVMVGAATTVAAGDKIRATTYNDNFARIYAEVRGNIGTLNLLDASVTTAKIVNQAVTTPTLADLNVTIAKLETAAQVALIPTGAVLDFAGAASPSGFVFLDGKSIGDAASGATERANADTVALFTLIYGAMADAQAPVSGGRGASAAADFAAHKTIALPDARGRLIATKDNLGGSTASRITAALNFDATVLGASGGSQSHVQTVAEMAAHSHGVTDLGHTHTVLKFDTPVGVQAGGGTAASTTGNSTNTGNTVTGIGINTNGSSSAFTIVQPTLVLTKIIKL